MEVTPLTIYLFTLVDKIRLLLLFVWIGGSIVGIPVFIASFDLSISNDVRNKWTKRVLTVIITSIILSVFIPSTKTLAAMYVIPPIVNNESVQELPAEILSFVKEYLKELKDE